MIYPKRPPYFAQRFIRLLARTCVAQDLGADVFVLLTVIVTTEDAKRYRGAVTYFNEPLRDLIGVKKTHTLIATRTRAIDAGWLHYEKPPNGSRRIPGKYWVTIPKGLENTPDSPMDEFEPMPPNGTGREEAMPLDGTGGGIGRGIGGGIPSYPSPLSLTPHTSGDSGHQANRSAGRKKKPDPKFTPEDMTLAETMLAGIRNLNPDFTEPDMPRWAECFRLMREQDVRTPEAIRKLIDAIQADDFERGVVLSPTKLRKRWDALQTKLLSRRNGKPHLSRVHASDGRYDNDDRY